MLRALVITAAMAACLAFTATADAGSMPRPAGVTVFEEPCPVTNLANYGCAYPDGRVYVWPRSRYGLSHELGHAFWFLVLTEGDRRWFMRRLRQRVIDKHTKELFADVYMLCDLKPGRDGAGDWPIGSTYNASTRRHARTCRAMLRVAKRNPDRVVRAPAKGPGA